MSPWWAILLAAVLIVVAARTAFSNSLACPFIFDDLAAIAGNQSVHHLWPIWKTLCPPRNGETVTGRPLLNLSLAINYAISGSDERSYHELNLAIHILGALLLLGVLRRTFLQPTMRDRFGAASLPLAFLIALLWAVHPLQTESVTYIAQRAESLVGLFYLLTLYCFIRGAEGDSPIFADTKIGTIPTNRGASEEGSGPDIHHSSFIIHRSSFIVHHSPTLWYLASVAACLLGMASKEVMVSAPLIVLLYDRTFCAGSFGEAWRRRYGYYLALAGTWLLLGWLVLSMSTLGTAFGPGTQEFRWWSYLLTQPGVIVRYLRLALWPTGLCLDYGWPPAQTVNEVLGPAILVVGLLVATLWALAKRPAWGFLGAWFFAILAPSSSFLPLGQAAFEHRMYLPLAAVATGLVMGGFLAGRWLVRHKAISPVAFGLSSVFLAALAAIMLGTCTFQRNLDYRSVFSVWEDTAAKAPDNAHAQDGFGFALAQVGRFDEAIEHYHRALEIGPDKAVVHNSLAAALVKKGRVDEAMQEFQRATEIDPNCAGAYYNMAILLMRQDRVDEAIGRFTKAVTAKPDYTEAHCKFGMALAGCGRLEEAMVHYQTALDLEPNDAEVHNHFGAALVECGRIDEAIAHFRRALEIKPDYAEARRNLAIVLDRRKRTDH